MRLYAALALVSLVTAEGVAQLPLDPRHDTGQSITPAYEGWYKNADGSFTLLVGYYNRNSKQTLDIPVGPDNRVEPGGPDRGQPTHFLLQRQWGVFTDSRAGGLRRSEVDVDDCRQRSHDVGADGSASRLRAVAVQGRR